MSPAAFLVLLLAAAQRAWNAWSLPPLTGYDVPGHAGYVLTILSEHRLPRPTEGWSTFHPPLYYLVGAVVWALLAPFGSHAVVAGLCAVGALAGLAAAVVAYQLVRRSSGDETVALVALALFLFVPCNQIAAVMIGNEAFAAGLIALALPWLLALQANPLDRRAAAMAGLISGWCAGSLAAASLTRHAALLLAAAVTIDALLRRRGVAALVPLAASAAAWALLNVYLTLSVPGFGGIWRAHDVFWPGMGFTWPLTSLAGHATKMRWSVDAALMVYGLLVLYLSAVAIGVARRRDRPFLVLPICTAAILLFHLSLTGVLGVIDLPRLTILAWPFSLLILVRQIPRRFTNRAVATSCVLLGPLGWWSANRQITSAVSFQTLRYPFVLESASTLDDDRPNWLHFWWSSRGLEGERARTNAP